MESNVLVTGAAGNVAQMLWPGLDGVKVRAVDVREFSGWAGADMAVGDLADPGFVSTVLSGVDAVVHLAANPMPMARWADLRAPNIDAVVNVLESARSLGVRKVVLASSVHAVGGYVGSDMGVIEPSWPARPCCAYGATKVFAEGYGHMVSATSDVSVVVLRLGACQWRPVDTGALAGWLAPDDLQRMVRAALDADVSYGTYFGVSANTRTAYDIDNARRDLRYEPMGDSEEFAAELPDGVGGMCLGRRSGIAR